MLVNALIICMVRASDALFGKESAFRYDCTAVFGYPLIYEIRLHFGMIRGYIGPDRKERRIMQHVYSERGHDSSIDPDGFGCRIKS